MASTGAGLLGSVALCETAMASPGVAEHAARQAGESIASKLANGSVPSNRTVLQQSQERIEVAIHVNQVGYLPTEAKRAVIPASGPVPGNSFSIVDEDVTPKIRYQAELIRYESRSGGQYGHYPHHYIAAFDSFDRPGRYRIRLSNGVLSSPFTIAQGRDLYSRLIPLTLNFFATQQCGASCTDWHERCHPDDGIILGGPRNGQRLDASGGWHDAGDYMKFVLTASYVTALLLFTYDQFPAFHPKPQPILSHFRDAMGNPVSLFARHPLPPLLAEARVGLEWLLKMHPTPNEFYFQVGDESDHDIWRLPESDCVQCKTDWVPRPVHFGVGANLAGRTAAAFAMASRLYASYDQPFAHRCYEAAQSVYRLGIENPVVQGTVPVDFYPEKTWEDDMAWGGAELYRATKDRLYLQQALSFAHRAGAAQEATSVYNTHALAHYTLVPLAGPEDRARLVGYLRTDAERARLNSTNPYGLATPYIWGTAEAAAGAAINCLLLARTLERTGSKGTHGSRAGWNEGKPGDVSRETVDWRDGTNENQPTYTQVARQQRDFILGCNPFNVSYLIGAGSHYPLFPHHPIANIRRAELSGALVGGPSSISVFQDQHIDLSSVDDGQMLSGPPSRIDQPDEVAVYHDAVQDYVTNEPAIDYTAKFLLMAAFYAS